MSVSPNTIVKITTCLVVVVLIAYCFTHFWGVMPLSVPPSQVAQICAPLLLTATFIERAVEVIISPLRDSGAAILRQRLTAAQAVDPPASAQVATATEDLANYQSITTQYAFSIAFLLGLGAAVVGVRTLGAFLPAGFTTNMPVSVAQFHTFEMFDVFLTAALLAGGANGLHAPINAFTSFFNSSASASLKTQP